MAQINKHANIYDIDGNLINKVDDKGNLPKKTIDEVEALVDKLTRDVADNPHNEVYKVYLNNAQSYLYYLYNNISKEDLIKRMTVLTDAIDKANTDVSEKDKQTLDEINKEVEKLKNSIESQEPPKETIMDEYVPYEEIK